MVQTKGGRLSNVGLIMGVGVKLWSGSGAERGARKEDLSEPAGDGWVSSKTARPPITASPTKPIPAT